MNKLFFFIMTALLVVGLGGGLMYSQVPSHDNPRQILDFGFEEGPGHRHVSNRMDGRQAIVSRAVWTEGLEGLRALRFYGGSGGSSSRIDGQVRYVTMNRFELVGSMTIAATVQFDSLEGVQTIVDNQSNFSLWWDQDEIVFGIGHNNNRQRVRLTIPVEVGQPLKIYGSYDETTQRLCVGLIAGPSHCEDNISISHWMRLNQSGDRNSHRLKIGQGYIGGNNASQFQGIIDHVRAWNFALDFSRTDVYASHPVRFQETSVDTETLALFHFNDRGPTTLDEVSVVALPIHGGVTRRQSAPGLGRALDFSEEGCVSCPIERGAPLSSLSHELTLEVVIELNSTEGERPVLYQSDRYLLTVSQGIPSFLLRDAQSGWVILSGSKLLTRGMTTHLAATYDGDKMCLYIQGHEDVCREVDIVFTEADKGRLLIGADDQSYFSGLIDEVRISSVARSVDHFGVASMIVNQFRSNLTNEWVDDEKRSYLEQIKRTPVSRLSTFDLIQKDYALGNLTALERDKQTICFYLADSCLHDKYRHHQDNLPPSHAYCGFHLASRIDALLENSSELKHFFDKKIGRGETASATWLEWLGIKTAHATPPTPGTGIQTLTVGDNDFFVSDNLPPIVEAAMYSLTEKIDLNIGSTQIEVFFPLLTNTQTTRVHKMVETLKKHYPAISVLFGSQIKPYGESLGAKYQIFAIFDPMLSILDGFAGSLYANEKGNSYIVINLAMPTGRMWNFYREPTVVQTAQHAFLKTITIHELVHAFQVARFGTNPLNQWTAKNYGWRKVDPFLEAVANWGAVKYLTADESDPVYQSLSDYNYYPEAGLWNLQRSPEHRQYALWTLFFFLDQSKGLQAQGGRSSPIHHYIDAVTNTASFSVPFLLEEAIRSLNFASLADMWQSYAVSLLNIDLPRQPGLLQFRSKLSTYRDTYTVGTPYQYLDLPSHMYAGATRSLYPILLRFQTPPVDVLGTQYLAAAISSTPFENTDTYMRIDVSDYIHNSGCIAVVGLAADGQRYKVNDLQRTCDRDELIFKTPAGQPGNNVYLFVLTTQHMQRSGQLLTAQGEIRLYPQAFDAIDEQNGIPLNMKYNMDFGSGPSGYHYALNIATEVYPRPISTYEDVFPRFVYPFFDGLPTIGEIADGLLYNAYEGTIQCQTLAGEQSGQFHGPLPDDHMAFSFQAAGDSTLAPGLSSYQIHARGSQALEYTVSGQGGSHSEMCLFPSFSIGLYQQGQRELTFADLEALIQATSIDDSWMQPQEGESIAWSVSLPDPLPVAEERALFYIGNHRPPNYRMAVQFQAPMIDIIRNDLP